MARRTPHPDHRADRHRPVPIPTRRAETADPALPHRSPRPVLLRPHPDRHRRPALHPRPLGDLLHPQPGRKRSLLTRRAEVARNPKLDHLIGVNGFFTDLYGHARHNPPATLHRWWGEARATAVYALAGVHPDGHGIWQANGRTVGFFLEHDRGTEALRVVLAKLTAYQRLAIDGPRYPVLIHLPTIDREVNLHDRLASTSLPIPVATTTHDQHPAGHVWALVGASGTCGARLRLHELPSDHGPGGISNPRRYEQQ